MTLADQVLTAMQEAAEAAIMPRFRALGEGDVEEKSPGEVVTLADREAERLISQALRSIRRDAVVIGEEATAENPRLLEAVQQGTPVWLVDPIDGTSNFIAGTHKFAVMVAFMDRGVTTHAWIWRPVDGEAWIAERGAGATLNGRSMQIGELDGNRESPRGSVRTRFLDEEHQGFVEASASTLGEILPGSGCAGFEYPEIVTGVQDFVLFRRTLPWDHAPGSLILQEAGGIVRRWDGSDYDPGDGKEGIIAARDLETWATVEQKLLQPRHRNPATS